MQCHAQSLSMQSKTVLIGLGAPVLLANIAVFKCLCYDLCVCYSLLAERNAANNLSIPKHPVECTSLTPDNASKTCTAKCPSFMYPVRAYEYIIHYSSNHIVR